MAGYYQVEADDVANGAVTCPADLMIYGAQAFPVDARGQAVAPTVGEVYCILTRDAQRYALIRIDAVCDQGVVIRFRYGGKNPVFTPQPPTSAKP
jgi:hypothetical protein